ncbi:MAG: hypothetical protein ACR2P2_19020 [Nakamurella sp.]
MTEEHRGVPPLDLTIAEKAARRSRTGGVWSLGHLGVCWATLLIAGAVLTVVGALVSGAGAAWGVVIGTFIVGLFFSISAVVIAKAGEWNPKAVLPAALGTYVVKIVALGVVLTVMPRAGFVDTRWMAGAVGLGLFCWLGAHLQYVWTSKILYVDPGPH